MALRTSAQGITADDVDGSLLVKGPIGSTLFRNSTADTNAILVKAGVTVLSDIILSNNGAAVAFVKLYNKATAPVVGTDVPVMVIAVPPSGNYTANLGLDGLGFPLGMGLGITNLIADADATAVAAGQVKVALQYR